MPGGKFALLLLRLGNLENSQASQLFVDMVFALLKLSFSETWKFGK